MTSHAIPESRFLFVIILLTNILNNIIHEIIVISAGDQRASSRAAVVIFVLLGVLFFGSLVVVHFVYICVLKHHYTSFLTVGLQTVGALLYYYGDNIIPLLDINAPGLECDDLCIAGNRTAAVLSLGSALIIFQIVPTIIHKFKKRQPKKLPTPDWISALDMITVLVKIDTIFSIVIVMSASGEYCSSMDTATRATFVVVCVGAGIGAEIAYCVYLQTTKQQKEVIFTCLTVIGMFAFVLCFPLYILADNHQPLDCVFGCDRSATNATLSEMNCDHAVNSGVRLLFNLITLAIVTIFSITFSVCSRRSRSPISGQEKSTVTPDTELKAITSELKDNGTETNDVASETKDVTV